MSNKHESYLAGWRFVGEAHTDGLATGVKTASGARRSAESFANGAFRVPGVPGDELDEAAYRDGIEHHAIAIILDRQPLTEREFYKPLTAPQTTGLVRYELGGEPDSYGRKLTKAELLAACDRLGVEAAEGMRRDTVATHLLDHLGRSTASRALNKGDRLELYHTLREVGV